MPRAGNFTTVHLTVAQRSTIMGTNVVDTVIFGSDPENDHQSFVDLAQFKTTIGNFSRLSDPMKFVRHIWGANALNDIGHTQPAKSIDD